MPTLPRRRVAARVLERNTRFHQAGSVRALEPRHIGLAATHRVMNTELNARLPGNLRGRLRVDAPERWQGLECPVMIVVHPFLASHVPRPSTSRRVGCASSPPGTAVA